MTSSSSENSSTSSSSSSTSAAQTTRRRNTSCMRKLGALKPLIHLILGLFIYILAQLMVVPVLTDVTLEALCPGQTECSQAIYLSGIQQVVAGIGTMMVTPILGDLSDDFGRKPMLMIPITMSILPMGIFAYSRTRPFVYTNMVLGTIVRMFSEAGIFCLAFAYIGDCVAENFRALAIGVLTGSLSLGYVMGILLARVLPEDGIFKVGTLLLACGAVYLKLFLPEPASEREEQLLPDVSHQTSKLLKRDSSTPLLMRSTSSITETVSLFRENKLLTQLAIIVFFSHLGEAGVQSSLLYYLKATFGFGKDQFAELMLISGVVSVISQLFVMPMFLHFFGEKPVLCIGLVGGLTHAFLYGVAWAPWVPYLSAVLGIFSVFVFPCIGCIVSKTAGPEDQGKLQGFIGGVKSFASILSPLAVSPLTALFLSDDAPWNCPGFSLICSASVMVVAAVQALILEPIPPTSISDYKASRFVPDDILQSQSQEEPLLV